MKSEFAKVGNSTQGQPGGFGISEQQELDGPAALFNAVDHLLGEDVREARREAAAELKRREAQAKAEAAAERRAEEKRLRQRKILAEMKRRQKEQEEALKKELERQREEALEAARRKAARERAKQLQALREKEEKEAAEARQKCLKKREQLSKLHRPTLYCVALMMPFGYEPGLMQQQRLKSASVFACDGYEVFSNTTTLLSNGETMQVDVTLMNGSLAVEYGGRWGTAMNTGVFNRLWTEVVRLGRYLRYDWTVKVDPDTVFFPHRLRNVLARRAPLRAVRIRKPRRLLPYSPFCYTCMQIDHLAESCPARVRAYQLQQNKSCAEALALIARLPPLDCGCVCDSSMCELEPVEDKPEERKKTDNRNEKVKKDDHKPAEEEEPEEEELEELEEEEAEEAAMYINNCKWGLHGPIEVFSRTALTAYIYGLPRCSELLEHPWGEDKFIDQCLQRLNITRVNEYDVLSETACGEQPSPCQSSDVAFHPFKSISSWFTCFNYASRYGKGPEDLDCNIKPLLSYNEAAYM